MDFKGENMVGRGRVVGFWRDLLRLVMFLFDKCLFREVINFCVWNGVVVFG